MIVKLDSKTDKLAGKITRETVEEMVNAYRNKPSAKKLCYAHFGLEEVIQFFIDNKVMSSGAMGHVIKDSGVKIYLGQHTDVSNCPPNRADYVGSDTTIICTTTIKEISTCRYEDHLTNEKNSILLSANTNKSGEGLDQSSTYPPDNPYSPTPIPTPTPCDAFDIGHPCP